MPIAPDKPDWRWHIVTPLLELSATRAAVTVQQLDPLTQRVYKFRRQYRDRFVVTSPDYAAAHELWHQRPYQRGILEGLIIGGATDEVIQSEMEIGAEDIAAYIAMFFDIRGRKRFDVCNMVFQGAPHRGYHQNDRIGTMQRLGWFGGYKLLQALVSQGVNQDDVQKYCDTVCRDIIRRQMPEMGLSVGGQSQFAHEYLKMAASWSDEQAASSEGGPKDEAVAFIMNKRDATVADGSDPRNLELPAEEPRPVVTYEVRNA